MKRLSRLLLLLFAVVGVYAAGLSTWILLGSPGPLEQLVVEVDAPAPADAIVCVGGGLTGANLPTEEGWQRIYTAVQLLADGLAPRIVFSGGGTEEISEAEVYAEAARWLGAPADALVLDPRPASTAEHPRRLLQLEALDVTPETPLLVVTSRLHSKRTAMTFRKTGFTHFRTVTRYEARDSALARGQLRSALGGFTPSGKSYGDPLNRLRWGVNDHLVAWRELLAIGVYRYRGDV